MVLVADRDPGAAHSRPVDPRRVPPAGRALRLIPTRTTKGGSFLAVIVVEGLLAFVTGADPALFEVTCALTEKGQRAAEGGEYEYALRRPAVVAPGTSPAEASRKASAVKRIENERNKVSG